MASSGSALKILSAIGGITGVAAAAPTIMGSAVGEQESKFGDKSVSWIFEVGDQSYRRPIKLTNEKWGGFGFCVGGVEERGGNDECKGDLYWGSKNNTTVRTPNNMSGAYGALYMLRDGQWGKREFNGELGENSGGEIMKEGEQLGHWCWLFGKDGKSWIGSLDWEQGRKKYPICRNLTKLNEKSNSTARSTLRKLGNNNGKGLGLSSVNCQNKKVNNDRGWVNYGWEDVLDDQGVKTKRKLTNDKEDQGGDWNECRGINRGEDNPWKDVWTVQVGETKSGEKSGADFDPSSHCPYLWSLGSKWNEKQKNHPGELCMSTPSQWAWSKEI